MTFLASAVLGARPVLERMGLRGTTRLVNATVRSGTADVRLSSGVRLRVNFADRVQRLMAFRLYERREIELVQSLLGTGDTMLDLGAHVGYFALHASLAVGAEGRVIAVEPAPSNFARLRENITLNTSSNVTAVPAAIGAESGRMAFQLVDEEGESGWGSLMLAPSDKTRQIEVEVVTVDDLLEREGIDRISLIKMDVQGSELDAMRGAVKTLASSGPDILCEVVEAWWGPSQTTTTADLFAFLRDAGYNAYGLPFRGPPEQVHAASDRYLNVLFSKAERFPGTY